MKLAYRALDQSGETINETLDAPSVEEAVDSLRRRGLLVAQIDPVEEAPSGQETKGDSPNGKSPRDGLLRQRESKRLKNMAMFTRQMFVLLSSGIQVVEALTSIENQTKDKVWHSVLERVRRKVEEGAPISEAMEEHTLIFDPVCRGLVAAGESAGKLPAMLDSLAQLTRKQLNIRRTIIGAMTYPAVLVTVSVSVLLLLLFFVLPRYAELFVTLKVPLPPSTQILLDLGQLLRSYWWLMLGGIVGSVYASIRFAKTSYGRRFMHGAVLRIPIIGKITRGFLTARMVRLIGILLDSYLPLTTVLTLVRQATVNSHYADLIIRAEQEVTNGKAISSAFDGSKLIDPMVVDALRNGEKTGRPGPMLLNVADFLDDENEAVAQTLTSIVEPIILIFLGLLIGFVAVSLFMPLFDLTAITEGGA